MGAILAGSKQELPAGSSVTRRWPSLSRGPGACAAHGRLEATLDVWHRMGLGLLKFAVVWVTNSSIHSSLLVRITAQMLSNLQFIPSNKLLSCSLAVLRNEVI